MRSTRSKEECKIEIAVRKFLGVCAMYHIWIPQCVGGPELYKKLRNWVSHLCKRRYKPDDLYPSIK